jgi:hypothetical protein
MYSKINSLKAGISGGIVGAIIIFLTTIFGILEYSQVAELLTSSIWGNFGYAINWPGTIIGAVFGFIYGFIIWWVFSLIYNKII